MKSLDEINPRTSDVKWKDQILWAEMPKMDQWYCFRVVGGVFTYAQHWVKFVTKQGKETNFPIDCLAWSNDLETVDPQKAHLCPGCQANIKPTIKYMFNVIDRTVQGRGDTAFIRGFELPPTAMKKVLDLKNLNMVSGRPFSVAHPDYGCDLYIQKTQTPGKKGQDWQFQKGDRSPLGEEEKAAELFEFDQIYAPGDSANARQSLVRAGYFGSDGNAGAAAGAPAGVSSTQMPPSGGAQLPPSSSPSSSERTNPIGFQSNPPTTAAAPQNVQLPVTNNAPVSGGLGRPPEAQGQTERPACFGGFLGAMECIKCPHKPQCLQVTSEKG